MWEPGIGIVTFIEFDGKPPHQTAEKDCLALVGLRDRYLETHRNGNLEQSTLDGIQTHFKHLAGTLGEGFPIMDLSMADLQKHIDRRAKKKGQRGKLSPACSEGNCNAAHRLELGSEHGTGYGQVPEQRAVLL